MAKYAQCLIWQGASLSLSSVSRDTRERTHTTQEVVKNRREQGYVRFLECIREGSFKSEIYGEQHKHEDVQLLLLPGEGDPGTHVLPHLLTGAFHIFGSSINHCL